MNYTASKLFLIGFCSIFVVIGLTAIVLTLYFRPGEAGTALGLVWGGMFVLIPLSIAVSRTRQISTFETMTYERYRANHPEHVRGNRVSCFVCGSARISARGLMNRTFHREHYCVQCGRTLYYSPERQWKE